MLTPGRYVGAQDAEIDDEPIERRIARLTDELFVEMEQARSLDEEIAGRLKGITQ